MIIMLGLAAGAAANASSTVEARKLAFQADNLVQAEGLLGVAAVEQTNKIRLEAPDIVDVSARSGARALVKVSSDIAATDWIAVFIEGALHPLVDFKEIAPGSDRKLEIEFVVTRTEHVLVIVRAGDRFYRVSREIKVAGKGCASK